MLSCSDNSTAVEYETFLPWYIPDKFRDYGFLYPFLRVYKCRIQIRNFVCLFNIFIREKQLVLWSVISRLFIIYPLYTGTLILLPSSVTFLFSIICDGFIVPPGIYPAVPWNVSNWILGSIKMLGLSLFLLPLMVGYLSIHIPFVV